MNNKSENFKKTEGNGIQEINQSNQPNSGSNNNGVREETGDLLNINLNNYPKFKYQNKKFKSNKKNRRNIQNQIKEDLKIYNDNKNVQYLMTSSSLTNLEELGTPIKLIKVNSISNIDTPIPLKKVPSHADKIKEFKDNIRKNSSYNLLEGIITEITSITSKPTNSFAPLTINEDDDVFISAPTSTKKNNTQNDYILDGIDIEELDNIPTYVSEKNKSNSLNQNNNSNNNQNKKNKNNKNKNENNDKIDLLFEQGIKSVNDIKDLEKKINDVNDYNLIHTPFKMIGEELLNEEINVKYRSKKQNNEYQLIVKKLKDTFKKLVIGDIKDKPNLSKILLDNELPEDVKLKILRKFIRYSTEDEVFSESADRIRLEINNLLKIKKVRSTNDFDDIWDQIEKKEMPSNLKVKLEDFYYRIITGDENKLTNYVQNVIKLPYHKIPNILDKISEPETPREEQIQFIKSIYKTLDENLFGLGEVKDSIVSYICQRINNPEVSTSKYLCLCGPAGVGKTSIVHAISEALKIPYSYISLANIDVSSTLIGHDYTYEGSTHGCIADALIKNECANGIILFDELDKCKEKIHNTLLGIFDPLQNCKFRDAYFGNFPIDLSQNIMIICLNDLEKINPILRDRLHIVHIPGYTNEEKKTIISKYILPKLQTQYKIDIQIEKDVIDYIVSNTSQHKGIRQLIMYLTKIYELAVLDKFTYKFNFGNTFKLKDLSHIKLQEDTTSKILNSMYV